MNDGPQDPHARSRPFTAKELMAEKLPPMRWVVRGLLPEGFYILAGKPKTGKSWLMLDLAVSVASGTDALGAFDVEQGDVLYLALEDGKRRLQDRLRKIAPDEVPEHLHFDLDSPRANQGGLKWLDKWLSEHRNTRLVVIDTFAKFRAEQKSHTNIYAEDYRAGEGIVDLARKHKVALVVVHHFRKQAGEDPIDEVSGSAGITGVADGVFLLKRRRNSKMGHLLAIGRDIEEQELKLSWSSSSRMWTVTGQTQDEDLSDSRKAILRVLGQAKSPMTPAEVAKALGRDRNAIKQLLWKMEKAGQIQSTGDGRYHCHNNNNR